MEILKYCNIWNNDKEMWWKPNRMGYTSDKMYAGLYPYTEVVAIVNDANTGSVRVHEYVPCRGVYVNKDFYSCFNEGYNHSINGRPSLVFTNSFTKEQLIKIAWHKHGVLHNSNSPAVITVIKDDCITHESLCDILVNWNDTYYKKFNIISSKWVNNGKIIDGVNEWIDENNISWPFNKDAQVMFALKFL